MLFWFHFLGGCFSILNQVQNCNFFLKVRNAKFHSGYSFATAPREHCPFKQITYETHHKLSDLAPKHTLFSQFHCSPHQANKDKWGRMGAETKPAITSQHLLIMPGVKSMEKSGNTLSTLEPQTIFLIKTRSSRKTCHAMLEMIPSL